MFFFDFCKKNFLVLKDKTTYICIKPLPLLIIYLSNTIHSMFIEIFVRCADGLWCCKSVQLPCYLLIFQIMAPKYCSHCYHMIWIYYVLVDLGSDVPLKAMSIAVWDMLFT